MLIKEDGGLYDAHEECNLAKTCDKYKTVGKFSGCQNIGRIGVTCFCLIRPDHPRIKLDLVYVKCES